MQVVQRVAGIVHMFVKGVEKDVAEESAEYSGDAFS
jgi:hypothetical protein